MVDKNLLIEKVRKSIIEIILSLIVFISLILIMVYSQSPKYKLEAFISVSIAVLGILGIYSVVTYKRRILKHASRERYHMIFNIIWNYTIAISVIFIDYKIYFSKSIIKDKYYWIYKFVIFYFIISITLKYIIKFIKKTKGLIAEKADFYEHGFNVLLTVWMLFFFNNYVAYFFYTPKKILDLSNAPKPCYLPVYEEKPGGYDLYNFFKYESKKIKIEDDKILESFMAELSKAPVENIRGLDYLNYKSRTKNETYYSISPNYKDSNGNPIAPKNFNKRLFSEMKLHRTGELVLINRRNDYSFPLIFKTTEIYRVNLSQELTDQILGKFENVEG